MKKFITISMLSMSAATQLEAQNWLTAGNAAGAADFLGTTNNTPLILKVNSQGSGRVESFAGGAGSLGNTSLGYQSLVALTTGNFNAALGFNALIANNSGSNNVAAGNKSMFSNTTGNNNTGLGSQTLLTNLGGSDNTATGFTAMYFNTSGSFNTANGSNALTINSTGTNNTAMGYATLYGNTTGNYNTAIGAAAMNGSNTGNNNTAIGASAMKFNTSGTANTATGYNALSINATGSNNTAMGYNALLGNTASNNSAFGYSALSSNTTGTGNTANGYNALKNNTATSGNTAVGYNTLPVATASNNTAVGYQSLTVSTTGGSNTALGYSTLPLNTTGTSNTAIGVSALNTTVSGSNNTGLGNASYPTGAAPGTITNWTAIGYSSGGAFSTSNSVELGNTSVTAIRAQVTGITAISDMRIKDNIKANVPGLEFINRLRPVTYNLNIHRQNAMIYKDKKEGQADWDGKYDVEKITQTGFLAQEVEKAAIETGYDFSGLAKPTTPDGLYGVRYTDFVMPLVKSVQELSAENETLKKQNEDLQAKFNELKSIVTDMQHSLTQCCSNYQTTSIAATTGNNAASLEQNYPNPFSTTTVIRCTVPVIFQTAEIKVTNAMGAVVMSLPINQAGNNAITITGGSLAAGMYQYTLVIDGKVVETKKMVLTK